MHISESYWGMLSIMCRSFPLCVSGMERRQLSGRRAKDAASSLIREVTGKKDRHSGNMANRKVCWLVCGY